MRQSFAQFIRKLPESCNPRNFSGKPLACPPSDCRINSHNCGAAWRCRTPQTRTRANANTTGPLAPSRSRITRQALCGSLSASSPTGQTISSGVLCSSSSTHTVVFAATSTRYRCGPLSRAPSNTSRKAPSRPNSPLAVIQSKATELRDQSPSAISALVWNTISAGTHVFCRRSPSAAQLSGKYSRCPTALSPPVLPPKETHPPGSFPSFPIVGTIAVPPQPFRFPASQTPSYRSPPPCPAATAGPQARTPR